MPDQTISTFEDRFHGDPLTLVAASHASSIGDVSPPGDLDEGAAPAVAIVNAGRWIARCPADDCGGAEYVSFDRPTFFCCECRNSDIAHAQRPVTLPDDRSGVEAALLARSDARNRHWSQIETVADLLAENEAHGVG